jgi:hypothetical protein
LFVMVRQKENGGWVWSPVSDLLVHAQCAMAWIDGWMELYNRARERVFVCVRLSAECESAQLDTRRVIRNTVEVEGDVHESGGQRAGTSRRGSKRKLATIRPSRAGGCATHGARQCAVI